MYRHRLSSAASESLQVHDALPEVLVKLKLMSVGQKLVSMKPLAPGEEETKGLRGYKEVWNSSRASPTLQKDKLYEAGGNLAWVSVAAAGPCPEDKVTLTTVACKELQLQPNLWL